MNVRLITNPNPLKLSALPNPEECLLSLGRSQLQACGEAIDRDLAKIIAWHLRNYHARSVQHVPQPTLEKRVACAVVKARGHGLGAISDLAGYAALMFELAPNFDEHPSFQRILGDPTIAPETKMRKLAQAITDREWDEAQRLYDRGFWVAVGKKTAQTK